MATTGPRDSGNRWIAVWDPLVRVFHWSLATMVLVALFSDENRDLHEAVGYAAVGLVLVRAVWGLIGTPHARFSSFVQSPRVVLAYFKDVLRFRARRYIGHNPAGGAMIVVMLVMVLVAGVSGWMSETDQFFGVAWVDHLHHYSAHLLLILVVFHVAGVVASSLLHRENLVRAMITGRKRARATSDIDTSEDGDTPSRVANFARDI